ncbi:hypothetical protein JOB18_004164 [Solea senegalensis]|uniref:Uncharacterized protein n=1 Tax=Solea senegalensis TaxID=28829 RepID=A0AAV6Q9Q0_SOLSE|nr:hypothetical protein JOB18_004164 [Solea senegalensis]
MRRLILEFAALPPFVAEYISIVAITFYEGKKKKKNGLPHPSSLDSNCSVHSLYCVSTFTITWRSKHSGNSSDPIKVDVLLVEMKPYLVIFCSASDGKCVSGSKTHRIAHIWSRMEWERVGEMLMAMMMTEPCN